MRHPSNREQRASMHNSSISFQGNASFIRASVNSYTETCVDVCCSTRPLTKRQQKVVFLPLKQWITADMLAYCRR